MNTQVVALAGVAVLAAAAGGAYVFADIPGLGTSPTGNVVKNAFELSTGSDLEVMKVEDLGTLNRVVLSDGNQVTETHVTDDGKYMVQNPIHLENYTKALEARQEFLSCLREQNAQFYGILGDVQLQDQQAQQTLDAVRQVTRGQVQMLGGTNGLNGIFQGWGTEGFPTDQVLRNGVVWRLNGEMVTGPQGAPQLEEATGCTYDAPTN